MLLTYQVLTWFANSEVNYAVYPVKAGRLSTASGKGVNCFHSPEYITKGLLPTNMAKLVCLA